LLARFDACGLEHAHLQASTGFPSPRSTQVSPTERCRATTRSLPLPVCLPLPPSQFPKETLSPRSCLPSAPSLPALLALKHNSNTRTHTLSLAPPSLPPPLSLSPSLRLSLAPCLPRIIHSLLCRFSLPLCLLPPSLPLSISPLSLWSSNSATARKNPTGCCFQRAHIGKAV